MSQNIVNEMTFFFHSLVLGAVITFVYDGFLILRRLVRHSTLLISLEDMIFWIACAIGVFYMLYEENNGILRWFAVLGAAIGMVVYKKTVSPFIIHFTAKAIESVFHVLFGLVRFFLRPVRFLAGKTHRFARAFFRKGRKIGKYFKNLLTGKLKLLKIALCKH